MSNLSKILFISMLFIASFFQIALCMNELDLKIAKPIDNFSSVEQKTTADVTRKKNSTNIIKIEIKERFEDVVKMIEMKELISNLPE